MRQILVLSFFIFSSACSLYEPVPLDYQAKTSKNLITSHGFDSLQNLTYRCFQSGSAPSETKGPVEVIDSYFEREGIATFIVGQKLVVYRVPRENTDELHHFCELNKIGQISKSELPPAIHLGVKLLD